MKKYMISILSLLLICSVLTGCSAIRTLDAAEDRIDHTLDTVENRIELEIERSPSPAPEQITQADAVEIALQHAGFTEDRVQYLHTDYEIDNRVPQYDISFHVGRLEYDYEIHAETGEILSFEVDN